MLKLRIGKSVYEVQVIKSRPSGLAEIFYQLGRIDLAERCALTGFKFTKQERAKAFWHEIVHGVLYEMRNPLAYNERFVTKFSELLTAVIKQADPHGQNIFTQQTKDARVVRKKTPVNNKQKRPVLKK